MHIIITRVAVFLFAASILACGSSEEKSSTSANDLPPFPQERFDQLLETCDYVDIIFYNTPISMSQDEPGSIRGALMFISPAKATLKEECNPVGRISYMVDGEIKAEGDFYSTPQCGYIVFMENDRPAYANVLSQDGLTFFNSILQQVRQQFPQQ